MNTKYLLAGACLAVAAYATSASAATEVAFYGRAVITASEHCTQGNNVGSTNFIVFHPRMSGNANLESLSVTYDSGGFVYTLPKASFTPVFQPVKGLGYGWGGTYKPDIPAQILMSFRSPHTIGATTRQVLVGGQIMSPQSDPGDGQPCVITFEGALAR